MSERIKQQNVIGDQQRDINKVQEQLINEETINQNIKLATKEEVVDEKKIVEEEIVPPQIDLKIASDNMVAYVRVKLNNRGQEVTVDDIKKVLQDAGVVYGICEEDIKRYCESKTFFTDVAAARGILPVDGENGTLEYHFKTDNSVNLIEKEDGKIDYRELGLVKNVGAGDVLATAHPAKEGVDGITIFGQRVPYIKGTVPPLQNGENTVISEDGTQILAAIDGCVELKGQSVVVNDVFTVKGDVDTSVGNIDCLGSVVIHGDVREGFIVKAKKDIVIKGMIEGATIISGGKVTISNGMNGMGKGKITAKGDVISKYFENATIESGGDIYSDVIMNSNTTAKGSVILKGGKSSIIGGKCKIGKMLYAGFIGSEFNTATTITIDSQELKELLSPSNNNTNKIQEIQDKISHLNFKQIELKDAMNILTKQIASDKSAKSQLKKVMYEKTAVAGEIAKLEQNLDELKNSSSKLYEYKVVATKMCYPGTRINIGYVYMNIDTDYSNSKFYAEGHTIQVGPVTPADRK